MNFISWDGHDFVGAKGRVLWLAFKMFLIGTCVERLIPSWWPPLEEKRLCEGGVCWRKYVTKEWILKFCRVALLPAVLPGIMRCEKRASCILTTPCTLSFWNPAPSKHFLSCLGLSILSRQQKRKYRLTTCTQSQLNAFSSPFPIAEASSPLQSCLWEAKVTQGPGETCPQPLLSLGFSLV